MIKPPADDTAIVADTETAGTRFLAEIEAKAQTVYPDHSVSREKFIREKVAGKITELEHLLREIEFRMQGLEK